MRGKNILKTLVVTTVLALSMTTIHAADTNVSFDGDAEDFIFLDGSQDLFDNFKNINVKNGRLKNIMPGEVRTQNIVLKNDDHRELRFYLSADVLDSLDTDTSGLSVYNITITNEGEEFYNGTLDDLAALSSGRMSEDTLLASLQKGETTTVTMTLEVNGDSMDNTYQNREGLIKFNFSVEELDDQSTIVEVVRNVYESIKTGDATVIAPLLGLVAVSGFAVIFLLKKKKHKEDCSHEEN